MLIYARARTQMRFLAASLALLLAFSGHARASYPTEVVPLDDGSFEHDTQAASGQTTGVWAVLFMQNGVKRSERALVVVEALAREEDKEVIFAKVDLMHSDNRDTAKRFGPVIDPPAVVLFRDRQMYVFDKPFDTPGILDDLRDFVTTDYDMMVPQEVPAYFRNTLNIAAMRKQEETNWMHILGGGALVLVGLIIHTYVIMNKDKFKGGADDSAGADAAAIASTSATAGDGGGGDAPAKATTAGDSKTPTKAKKAQ